MRSVIVVIWHDTVSVFIVFQLEIAILALKEFFLGVVDLILDYVVVEMLSGDILKLDRDVLQVELIVVGVDLGHHDYY